MKGSDAHAIKHDGDPKFEYDQITEHIYIGTNACCVMHYSEMLQKMDITADISLEGEQMDDATGAEYFLWLPTIDHTPPTLKKLQLGVAAMKKLIEMNEKIYVHCKNGHGRAPTMVAAYFISTGDTVEDAIGRIAAKRPEIHIEPDQKEQLKRFTSTFHDE